MAACPTCAGGLALDGRFCPDCGRPVSDVAETPTGTAPRGFAVSPPPSPSPGRPRSSGAGSTRTPPGPSVHGRFVPGALVAERYRIVGLIGKGGMGEVYRADDLMLGQTVALKFLPEALNEDVSRLERFYNEVRLAREISHPAVCRVHDVDFVDGHCFLSMEYVDGENLASLLRRIGRVPQDKAVEIAIQLATGLAAAHDKGVLHRDLKPENVMLDGRGKVRITDFGLAALADAVIGDDVRSGTPAYMSPEQLEGREVTIRSDVYALGLVLYEMFSGKRAFDGKTLSELMRQHENGLPPLPSAVVQDLDPVIERAILRCLAPDPRERPGSALALAAALPGGDPLAAALAAGETPSPELVAAAGLCEGIPARTAWTCVALSIAAMVLVPALSPRVELFQQIPLEKSVAVLEDRARELLRKIGYATKPLDSVSGFFADFDYFQYVSARDRSPGRWDGLRTGEPPVVQFWYRESPRFLIPSNMFGHLWWNDPSLTLSNMTHVRLDTQGRLIRLDVVTPQVEAAGGGGAVDWLPLFDAAGLDPAHLEPIASTWTPPVYADARAAWKGVYPRRPEIPIWIEAAAYRGAPVYFQVRAEWTRPERSVPFEWTGNRRVGQVLSGALFLALVIGAAIVAKRNVRMGRGDRLGALRLAAAVVAAMMVQWALRAHHVPAVDDELVLVIRGLGSALVIGLLVWTLYLAVEPYVRRRWPHTLISWTRLLGGGWNDPIVGRDVLIGVASGAVVTLLDRLALLLARPLGQPQTPSFEYDFSALLGLRAALADVIVAEILPIALAMGLLLVLMLFRTLLRSEWLAGGVVVLLLTVQHTLFSDVSPWVEAPVNFVLLSVPVLVLLRYGLLPCVVGYYVSWIFTDLTMTWDLSSWTATPTLVGLGAVGLLTLHGFQVALRPRRA